jgi:methylated-DNA-[protein]-cysteine S-methyltransferase
MVLVADAQGRLLAVEWTDNEARLHRLLRRYLGRSDYTLRASAEMTGLTGALAAYFGGDPAAVDALPVGVFGTEFQRRVWQALRAIPAGRTLSYGALARRIGQPAAVRAVGLANAANPVGIVVPCHRVIGADGTLTGYGGGLDRKGWLLAHEGAR